MRVEFLVVTNEHGSLSAPSPPFEKREGWGSLVIGAAKMGQMGQPDKKPQLGQPPALVGGDAGKKLSWARPHHNVTHDHKMVAPSDLLQNIKTQIPIPVMPDL